MSSKIKIGEKVEIIKGGYTGQTGRLAYEGKVKFGAGIWYGISLDKAVGKHDGVVQGTRYFTAGKRFGAFVKRDALKKLSTSKSSGRARSGIPTGRGSGIPAGRSSRLPGPSRSRGNSPARRAGPPRAIRTPSRNKSGKSSSSKSSPSKSSTKRGSKGSQPPKITVKSPTESKSSDTKALSEKNAQIQELKSKLENVQNELAAANLEIKQTKAKLVATEEELETTRQSGTASEGADIASARQLKLAELQLSSLQDQMKAERSEYESEIKNLKGELSDAKEAASLVESSNVQDDSKFSAELTKLKKENENLRAEVETLKAARRRSPAEGNGDPEDGEEDEAKKALDKKETIESLVDASAVQEEIDAVKKEYEEKLEKERNAADTRVKNLKAVLLEEKLEIQRQRDERKRRLDHVTGNLEKINEMYNKTQAANVEAEKKLKEAVAEKDRAKKQLEIIKLDKEEMEYTVEEKEEEILGMKLEIKNFQNRVVALEEKLRTVKNDIITNIPQDQQEQAKLVDTNRKLTEALVKLKTDSEQQIEQLKAEMQVATSERDEMAEEMKNAEELEENLTIAEEQVKELREELEGYANVDENIEAMTEKLQTVEEELEKEKKLRIGLEKINETNSELIESQNEVEQELQDELSEKESQLSRATQTIKKLIADKKDLSRTQEQFRELCTALEEENKELKMTVGDISSDKRVQVAKAKTQMVRNLKLQSTASEARARTVAFHLSSMRGNQADQFAHFIKAYIPEAVEINDKMFGVLSLLERLRFTAMLIGSMLSEHSGIKAVSFDVNISELTYKACGLTVDICEAVQVICISLRAADEMDAQAVVLRSASIAAVEKSLSQFLDVVANDQLSGDTKLDPLNKAVKLLREFHEKNLGEVKMTLTKSNIISSTKLEVLRTYYKHLVVCAKAKQMEIDFAKISNSRPEEKEESAASNATISQLSKSISDVTALSNTIFALYIGLARVGKTPESFGEDGTLPEKLLSSLTSISNYIGQYYESVRTVVSDFSGADSMKLKDELCKTLDGSMGDLNVAIEQSHKELSVLYSGLDTKVNGKKENILNVPHKFITAMNNEEDPPLWVQQAEIVRKELAETAGNQAELKQTKEALASNKKDLARLTKELQTNQKKESVYKAQIDLLQQDSTKKDDLQSKIRDYENQLAEKRNQISTLKGDTHQMQRTINTLKRHVEEEKKKSRSRAANRTSTMLTTSLAPEEVQQELRLLQTTVVHLHSQYSKLKWKSNTLRLQKELPPLPSFTSGDTGDPTSETGVLARELRVLSMQVMHLRCSPKLVDLTQHGVAQNWLVHLNKLRMLAKKAREIQRRLTLAGGSSEAKKWAKGIQEVKNPRLVGRITLPTLPKLSAGASVPRRVLLTSQQMAQICRPLTAW